MVAVRWLFQMVCHWWYSGRVFNGSWCSASVYSIGFGWWWSGLGHEAWYHSVFSGCVVSRIVTALDFPRLKVLFNLGCGFGDVHIIFICLVWCWGNFHACVIRQSNLCLRLDGGECLNTSNVSCARAVCATCLPGRRTYRWTRSVSC